MYLLTNNNESEMQARETCKRFVSTKECSNEKSVHAKESFSAKECSNEKFCSCKRVCLGIDFV